MKKDELLPRRKVKVQPAHVSFRMNAALLEQVDAIAEKEGFSRARILESFIEAAVREYEGKKR